MGGPGDVAAEEARTADGDARRRAEGDRPPPEAHGPSAEAPRPAGARDVGAPASAAGAGAPARPAACPNCGAEVLGEWCHRCGQRHRARVLPLRSLAADALAQVFSVDGRLARTLRVLFLRPGRLTEAYLEGRRRRYLPPFRLYLAASVLYFGVLSLTGTKRFLLFTAQGVGGEFEGFVSLLPKLMIVLLPLFAWMLHGLFRGRERLYTEHLVFSLHYHALVFAVYPVNAVLEVVRPDGGPGHAAAVALALALHGYLLGYLAGALRRVYGGSWTGAALRTLALWAAYAALLGIVGTLAIPSLRAFAWSAVTGG